MEINKAFKIGLIFGGGGIRGFAHLGVLKVLEEEKIPVDLIAGTSFGSLIGGLYAVNPDAEFLKEKILRFLKTPTFKRARLEFLKESFTEIKDSTFFSQIKSYFKRGIFYGISLNRGYFISSLELQTTLNGLIDNVLIEETKIPFLCVSTNIRNGSEVIFTEGPLRTAIAASCAIPGIFPPVKLGDHELVDGSWVNRVPIEPALRAGATFTIAIEASNNLEPSELKRGIEIVLRSSDITRNALSEIQLKLADIVIRPDVGHIHWAEFHRGMECFVAGEKAARSMVDAIRREIRNKRLKQFILGKPKMPFPSNSAGNQGKFLEEINENAS
ncbi:MAG TPA: patatin-like phospholipase family protein [Nitrospiria bacterium]|nr:patatin-like phospholipase family protein [Nitrospiria bacterium]